MAVMMKLAIVGSRPENMGNLTENDKRVRAAVYAYVSKLAKDTVIVSGGAAGVDTWAENAAKEYGLPKPIIFKPEWKKYGKPAGMIRNAQIIDAADCVTAFWNGISSGTANSIERARRAGKSVVINPGGK
jgi:hypothetical protein